MHWPRLTKRCEVCQRKLWLWQGFTKSTALIAGTILRAIEPHIVCSDRCACVVSQRLKEGRDETLYRLRDIR